MKKKILIAGGSGYLGEKLALKCLSNDMHVDCIYEKTKGYIKDINYIKCDLTNKASLKKKLKKNYDYVVNLAGEVSHQNKKKIYKLHFFLAKNLLDFFEKKNLNHFVQIGSSAEYGKKKFRTGLTSRVKPNLKNISHYGKAKLNVTKYALKKFKKKLLPVTIVRAFQIFGKDQPINRFIPIIIDSLIKKKEIKLIPGNCKRDFLYVDDFINFLFKVIISPNTYGKILNVGSGKPIKIKNLIDKICKIIKINKRLIKINKIKLRQNEPEDIYPNIVKEKKLLKWSPMLNLAQALNLTIKTYEKKY